MDFQAQVFLTGGQNNNLGFPAHHKGGYLAPIGWLRVFNPKGPIKDPYGKSNQWLVRFLGGFNINYLWI